MTGCFHTTGALTALYAIMDTWNIHSTFRQYFIVIYTKEHTHGRFSIKFFTFVFTNETRLKFFSVNLILNETISQCVSENHNYNKRINMIALWWSTIIADDFKCMTVDSFMCYIQYIVDKANPEWCNILNYVSNTNIYTYIYIQYRFNSVEAIIGTGRTIKINNYSSSS